MKFSQEAAGAKKKISTGIYKRIISMTHVTVTQ